MSRVIRQKRAAKWLLGGPLGVRGICDIVSAYGDGLDGECVLEIPNPTGSVYALAPLPGDLLAIAGESHRIHVFDVESRSGVCVGVLAGHSGRIHALAALPRGAAPIMLASGSSDQTIRIWDVLAGICLITLSDHYADISALAVFPIDDASFWIASVSYDKTVRVWNIEDESSTCLRVLTGHTDSVYELAALPGTPARLASGSADKNIRIWDVLTGICLITLSGHGGWVGSMVVLPGMPVRLASGSGDDTIRIWNVDVDDAEFGSCMRILRGHTDNVTTLAMLPNGQLVSGSWDRTIRIWDINEHSAEMRLLELNNRPECISALAALPDGRLAACAFRKPVRICE